MYRIPLILLFILSGLILPAQKSKVFSAYNYHQAFYNSKDCAELGKAKDAIELALTNEASSTWAKTWFYRGNIYYDIFASQDMACKSLSSEALDISYNSYMKAMEYDTEKRYREEIEPKISVISGQYVLRGASNFNVKKYEEALSDFEKALEVAQYFSKTDTTALYNAALTCERLGNYSKAAHYYEGLVDMGYKNPKVYHFLSESYLLSGDSARAFQAIVAGRKLYPRNQDLIIDELNYYLQKNQEQLAMNNLVLAIQEMPDNAELYFAKGTLHDKAGEIEMAELSYKKAIEIKPDYFNANYNLGALYFNIGVEYVNKANSFSESQQKQFKEAEDQSKLYFDKALPYLEKANALDPNDKATMISLKNLYSRTGNDAGYKRISDLLDN